LKKTYTTFSGSFIYCLSIILTFSFFSCSKESDSNVLIRINNVSTAEISNVVVYSLNGEFDFGSVNGGALSAYKTVGATYNAPVCSFNAYGKEYRVMVRCANPAPEKISSGHYTIRINFVTGQESEIELIRE